jgi:hypothetical protein
MDLQAQTAAEYTAIRLLAIEQAKTAPAQEQE